MRHSVVARAVGVPDVRIPAGKTARSAPVAGTSPEHRAWPSVGFAVVVVRTYAGGGATELLDLLDQRKTEVEAVIRSVPGLVSYTMARTGDGGITVTVCNDKAGADESLRIAREWIQKNATGITLNPPAVAEGLVVFKI